MANLGTIAATGNSGRGSSDASPRIYFRSIVCGDRNYPLAAISITEGNPATPCLRVDMRGNYRFRWTVRSGTRTIQVNVKQAINASPRPRLTIKANTQVGLATDTSSSAASSTGWVTIGPVTIAPTISGVVWVVLESLYDPPAGSPTYWDHIVTT